jgi:hypothetical protein
MFPVIQVVEPKSTDHELKYKITTNLRMAREVPLRGFDIELISPRFCSCPICQPVIIAYGSLSPAGISMAVMVMHVGVCG